VDPHGIDAPGGRCRNEEDENNDAFWCILSGKEGFSDGHNGDMRVKYHCGWAYWNCSDFSANLFCSFDRYFRLIATVGLRSLCYLARGALCL